MGKLLIDGPPHPDICLKCRSTTMNGDCMLWKDESNCFTNNAGIRIQECLEAEKAAAAQEKELVTLRARVTELKALVCDTPHTYAISEMLVILDPLPGESANAAAKRLRAKVGAMAAQLDALDRLQKSTLASASTFRSKVEELEACLAFERVTVAELTARAAKLEKRLEIDPGGSDKIDELEQAAQFLRHELDLLKAPPVVPLGWRVELLDTSRGPAWRARRSMRLPMPAALPPVVLRALAWARENNTRPPHAEYEEGETMRLLNIRTLRREHPEWAWATTCYVGGWMYRGTRDGKKVSIRASDRSVEQFGHPKNPHGWWYVGKYQDWKGEVVP